MNAMNRTFVTPLFQLGACAISGIIIALLFFGVMQRFNAHDVILPIEPYITSEATEAIATVTLGLHIQNFSKSDVIKNEFMFEGALWCAYDPRHITRQQIDAFTLEQGHIIDKSKPQYVQKDGIEIAYYTIRAEFFMQLKYKYFPLDDHRLFISFTNPLLPPDKYHIITQKNSFTMDTAAHVGNCVIRGKHIQTGQVTHTVQVNDHTERYATQRTLFIFDCEKVDARNLLNIFLPLYLIFFLSLFGFSFVYSEHLTDVPAIAAAGIPALFAYRFVIESMSPNVSYFMLSDYLFLLFLFITLLAFVAVAWRLNGTAQQKKRIIVTLYTMMIIGCIFIIYLL